MMIGIVSCLPENEERIKRKECVTQLLSFIRGVFPKKEVVILAQNYSLEDYIQDTNITYISYPKTNISKARNIILKRFYDSKEDYLLLLDDTILYDYYDATALLKELDKTPTKFFMCDRICANNPHYSPFKVANYADKNIQTHWKFVKYNGYAKMPFCVIKNIAKHTGLTIYFTEPQEDKQDLLEEIDFHAKWINKGFASYACEQWQMKELLEGEQKNCIADENAKITSFLQSRPQIVIVSHRRRKTRPQGYVKRAKKYEYTDKEIPKR